MEDNNYTLEQMRADYQTLKESLAGQEIINDRLLRNAMKAKVKSINSKVWVSVLCAVFVMLAAPFSFHYNPVVNASWWFVGATEVLMLAIIFIDWKFNHKVSGANLATCDLLTFSKDVRTMREHYRNWRKWALLIVTVWFGWLAVEVALGMDSPRLAISLLAALLAGGILGGLLGLRLNRQVVSACDEIIADIETK